MIAATKLRFGWMRRDQRGVVFLLAALLLLVLIGFAAVTVDLGYVYLARRRLQATADFAALAGAMSLSSGYAAAESIAISWSASPGGKNVLGNWTVTTTPTAVTCTGGTGGTCSANTSNPNGMMVTETAKVPTFFGRALGLSTIPVSATSYALAAGGKAQDYDIMMILDTTASMGELDRDTSDPSCAGDTREQCALIGLQALLTGFNPLNEQVGLMIFPGLKTAAATATEYCVGGSPYSSYVAPYNASANPPTTQPPYYLIVGLSGNYQIKPGVLNSSSDLVVAAGAGASCKGVIAFGGVGTYYANVVTAAQNYLTAHGRSNSQKMIILLSDGDANSNASPPAGQGSQECHKGIAAAAAAKAAGMTVATIAYGSPTTSGPGGGCNSDTNPAISPCQTMVAMATVGNGTAAAPEWFYTDDEGRSACNSASHTVNDLTGIFNALGTQITSGGARLIPST